MTNRPITGLDDALLRTLNAAATFREEVDALIADGVYRPDEDAMEAVEDARSTEKAAMAYLNEHAAKCPSCKEAFAFQRQAKRPDLCSWCGYDHATGKVSTLVPASSSLSFRTQS